MNINVVWQSYHDNIEAHGNWDMAMLEDLFSKKLWTTVNGYNYSQYIGLKALPPDTEGAVVVLPARHHTADLAKINDDLAKLPWVLLILVGDEESAFPVAELKHPNMKVWVMTPHPTKTKADRYLINGYAPDTKLLGTFNGEPEPRNLDWFFAGQITHERRHQCLKALKTMRGGAYKETSGFTQGFDHLTYYGFTAQAKFIPCPSGPCSPDSFRLAEALEAGCIPIADTHTPDPTYPSNYWSFVFGQEPPFPLIDDWSVLPEAIKAELPNWSEKSSLVFSWWQQYKRDLAYNLEEDIAILRDVDEPLESVITILIPTSPIESHPDTSIIEETIKTVRHHFPTAEILLMIDGIRPEQRHFKKRYEMYKRRLLWKCNNQWHNVLPIVFDTHYHQASMTKKTLGRVKTPMILFVEHDTPIVTDCEIDWVGLINIITSEKAYVIRLLHEACIQPDHDHLMVDKSPQLVNGLWMLRTVQWSQRPHLASTNFYRRILHGHFSEGACTMIEDRMHGVVQDAYALRNETGWNEYRIMIYAPDGNKKRSYHLDGRGKVSKFEGTMIY